MINTILQIPQSVREDVLGYRAKVQKFIDGETKPVSFKAYRVPMGIYEQRDAGKYMVRIRIGAGKVLPGQLVAIANLGAKYGNGVLHVTTRQDIQIHEVAIEETADVLEGLLEAGLSARGGGGNTVRNVSACPRTGVCPSEKFDVGPYAIAVAEYLLQTRSSFNLPRKYKIVFSGCANDCGLASVADLGFFAGVKDGRKGFAVYAAGGLGGSSRVAIQIEEFIEADEIFEVAEAIKQVFDKHGDRSDKHKARLRFVLKRLGEEAFIKLYTDQRAAVKASGLIGAVPAINDDSVIFEDANVKGNGFGANILAESREGKYTVRLRLAKGDISAENLAGVAQVAKDFGCQLRTTQQQDMLICGVAESDIVTATKKLKEYGIDVGEKRPKVVACAGAATCKLGLCLSRGLADAINEKLKKTDAADELIRISGCPNSCGHHSVAPIGFQGRAKRVNGKLLPSYDVFAGAKIYQGQAKLAKKIATVPAKRIPDMMAEVIEKKATAGDALKKIVGKYDSFAADGIKDDYYYDFGCDEVFSLAGRGPGECGAGVMDILRVDIDEAAAAIKAAGNVQNEKVKSGELYKAVVASARALLVVFGLEPRKEREIFAGFEKHLIEPGWVSGDSKELLDAAMDHKLGDRDSLADLSGQIEGLVIRVKDLFASLDASLKFTIAPAEAEVKEESKEEDVTQIDLKGVTCPMNFVKAKLALEKVAVGGVLEVLLDGGAPVQNVPASFTEQGQEVVSIEERDGYFSIKVLRKQ